MRSMFVDTEVVCKWCKNPMYQLREDGALTDKGIVGKLIAVFCPNCDVMPYEPNQRPE